MWRIVVITALTALAACSTGRAVKVRCDRHLVRINALIPAHALGRSASAAGDKR